MIILNVHLIDIFINQYANYRLGVTAVSKPIPKWLQVRYAALWKAFRQQEFSHDAARDVLHEANERLVSVVLSTLKRHGWLAVALDPGDSRKRRYTLKDPLTVVMGMGESDG